MGIQIMDKPNKNNENCQAWQMTTNFEEIFYQSPIGILLYDKEGRLTNANDSALNIAKIPRLNDVLGTNIFDNPLLASKKEDLREKGLINFQDSLDLIQIKEQNIYNPVEPKIIEIDWTVSVTDSGYLIQIQDITEQKKVEGENKSLLDSVQAERDLLSALINNIPDEVWFADKNKKFTLVNPSAQREFGLINKDIDIEELASTLDVYLPDGSPRPVEEAPPLRALKGENIRNMQEIVRNPTSNELRYRQVNASPVKDANKNIIGSISLVRDITDHKKTIEALKESEEKYRNLFNTMDEGFAIGEMIFDENGKPVDYYLIEVNPTFEKFIGLSKEQLIGKSITSALPNVSTRAIESFGNTVRTGKPFQFENYSQDLDRWYRNSGYKIRNNQFGCLTVDITESKKIEEKLKIAVSNAERHANELNITIESIADGVVIYNKNGDIVQINDVARKYFVDNKLDSKDKLIERVKKYVWSYSDQTPLKSKDVPAYRALQGEIVKDAEVTLKSSKELVWLRISAKPLYNKFEGLFGAVVTFNDITKRKLAEEAVKESEARFNEVLDSLSDVFLIVDSKWRYVYVNAAAEKFAGRSSDEMLGKVVCNVLPNFLNSIPYEQCKKTMKDKIPRTWTTKAVVGDIWSEFRAYPWKDGFSLFIRDISERKKVEESLIESEERYHSLFDNNHAVMLLINPDNGDIIDANPAATHFYGYSYDELVKMNINNINVLSEVEIHDKMQKSVSSQQNNFLFKHQLASGEIRDVDVYSGTIVLGGKKLLYSIVHDVTDRLIAQNKLKESNIELERFAYITSHDLREPLRMITSFLQLLERRYKDRLDDDANEFIRFAVDGAKRLDAMTNDLLQYSKITSEKREIKPVNFEHVLEHALENLKVQIEENNAIITHDNLPTINGDEQLKIQLFQNLISNSIKYRSQETPEIHISAKKEKNQYIFSFKDNGIGMSHEYLEKIFIIFKRLHTREEYEGTGIGLAIAQKIVHQQGGQIWAESEPGKGSTFYFTIPTT